MMSCDPKVFLFRSSLSLSLSLSLGNIHIHTCYYDEVRYVACFVEKEARVGGSHQVEGKGERRERSRRQAGVGRPAHREDKYGGVQYR